MACLRGSAAMHALRRAGGCSLVSPDLPWNKPDLNKQKVRIHRHMDVLPYLVNGAFPPPTQGLMTSLLLESTLTPQRLVCVAHCCEHCKVLLAGRDRTACRITQ